MSHARIASVELPTVAKGIGPTRLLREIAADNAFYERRNHNWIVHGRMVDPNYRPNNKAWTPEEDRLLRTLRLELDRNWKRIAYRMRRSITACRSRSVVLNRRARDAKRLHPDG